MKNINPQLRAALLKKAEELKEEAKKHFLKKVAALKTIEQYIILKDLEKK